MTNLLTLLFSTKMVLECKNFSLQINYKSILKSISFTIEKGSVVLLKGENGSGKSSLLKSILNYKKFTNYFFLSNNSSLSYLGHELGLYSTLSLNDNLGYFSGIYSHLQNEKTKQELLSAFQLTKRLDEPVEIFSRGMKQKSALIRSLMVHADLFLLDEPFSNLDQKTIEILKDFISKNKKNQSYLVVTHDTNIESSFYDKILELNNGILQTN